MEGNTDMRKLLFVLLFVLIFFVSCADGSSTVAGTYLNDGGSTGYLELSEDGSFYLSEFGIEYNGTWKLEGNTLFFMEESGLIVGAKVENGKIIDNDGLVWIKDEEAEDE